MKKTVSVFWGIILFYISLNGQQTEIFENRTFFPKQQAKLSYFERIGRDAFRDMTHTFTDMPGVYKNMFAVPFSKVKLKNTGIQIGVLATSFLFDESFNDFSRDDWEPFCEKEVQHMRLPLPILILGGNAKPVFIAANSFNYDHVFLIFAEYGYLFGLLTSNNDFRNLCHELLQVTTYSFIFAQPVKALIGRARPSRERNDYDDHTPWEWGNSNFHLQNGGEFNSFPSFHATFYNSYCTIIMDHLGYRWAGPILGSFFFFQEPAHDHWISDIIAGQIFGYWLASSILDKDKISKKSDQFQANTQILFAPHNGGIAVNLSYSF
ncbi:MAG: phosphatase PAP2 family protein [Candidatus Cloacimonadales bacterium]|nr:phosphatase PAP2 family protein [Candidatus Cloacimonadales bacterium]